MPVAIKASNAVARIYTHRDETVIRLGKVYLERLLPFSRLKSALTATQIPAVTRRLATVRTLSRLKKFENLHAGQRCFIIGNGPSLNLVDLSLLANEITFGSNGIFYKADKSGFEPTYYCVEDQLFFWENRHRIKDVKAIKFLPRSFWPYVSSDDRSYIYNDDRDFYAPASEHYHTPRFSKKCSKSIYCGQTVTYLLMQLAFYMGFKEVYLIGMDFSYIVPATDFVEDTIVHSQGDDPNHFDPQCYGAGKRWFLPNLDMCSRSYRHAKEIFEQDGRIIYNSTVGGKLEIFPRKSWDDLIPSFCQK